MGKAPAPEAEAAPLVVLTVTVEVPADKYTLKRYLDTAVRALHAGIETWSPGEGASGNGLNGDCSFWFAIEPRKAEDESDG